MGAPIEYYVDPSIAADSGTGTSGDPYGDLQYALNQVTRNATHGDRFNIKAGTDEVLIASLSFGSYGTATVAAPVILQGYTSLADDGGIGGIDGDGTYGIIANSAYDCVLLIDLHCHNCGSAAVLVLDNDCQVINCEIDNTTGNGIDFDARAVVIGCNIHNCGGIGIACQYGNVFWNYLSNGTNDFTHAIDMANSAALGALCSTSIILV